MGSGEGSFAYDAPDARERVLVVCAEPRVLAEIKRELMPRFAVSIASTADAAAAVLAAHGADAVVIHIGGESGWAFSAFARISEQAAEGGTPVLFLAERDDEGDEARALEMGAADYALRRRAGNALISRIGLRILAAEGERRAPDGTAAAEAILAGRTILIAEDIALNQEIIATMLSEAEGLTVAFASNGREAVELFEKNPGLYSLIFMDIHMPEMNGLSAARAIRSIPRPEAREIPIIALTATAGKDEVTDFLQAGMNGYLEKPMEYGEFLRVCAKYCG